MNRSSEQRNTKKVTLVVYTNEKVTNSKVWERGFLVLKHQIGKFLTNDMEILSVLSTNFGTEVLDVSIEDG